MKPLNYAILKHFTRVKESSIEEVIEDLKGEYSEFKAFNKKSIINALMTEEANGLIEETRCKLNKNGEVIIYYMANKENKETINSYIED